MPRSLGPNETEVMIMYLTVFFSSNVLLWAPHLPPHAKVVISNVVPKDKSWHRALFEPLLIPFRSPLHTLVVLVTNEDINSNWYGDVLMSVLHVSQSWETTPVDDIVKWQE
jgi:hypothetical protein